MPQFFIPTVKLRQYERKIVGMPLTLEEIINVFQEAEECCFLLSMPWVIDAEHERTLAIFHGLFGDAGWEPYLSDIAPSNYSFIPIEEKSLEEIKNNNQH